MSLLKTFANKAIAKIINAALDEAIKREYIGKEAYNKIIGIFVEKGIEAKTL
jgi:hypothetical protein